MKRDVTLLSLGAGVQSTALLVLANRGDCGPVDAALFADTQAEPQYVYDHLKRLMAWSRIPIQVVTAGNLWTDTLAGRRAYGWAPASRFNSLPFFTRLADGSVGMLKRQCTKDYKLVPLARAARALMGYGRREPVRHRATVLIGISADEAMRARDSGVRWRVNQYPLLDRGLTRQACLGIIREAGLPEPQKSACVFCPFHDDRYWVRLRDDYPEEWARAVEFDAKIRHSTRMGARQPCYLHSAAKPLDQVRFQADFQYTLALDGFGAECEGMCGT